MIKLFRNIRKKLIEQSKVRNYFFYAIGEIILVVIGILIALQINNWNEYQKQKQQESVYLQNLKDDLTTQIQSLEIYINFEDIILQNCQSIIHHYEANDGFQNMDSIYPKLNDLSVRWTFVNANTTLLEMINSGQINLIRNKNLKKELMDFNQLVQRFASNTQHNNTNLIDNLIVPNIINSTNYAYASYSNKMKNQFRSFVPVDFVKVADEELQKLSNENLKDPKLKLKLINNVAFRSGMAAIQKSGNMSLKERAIELLNHIETELSK